MKRRKKLQDRRSSRFLPLRVESLERRLVLTTAIDVELETNGDDADTAPGVLLDPGDAIEWTYRVTNTGTVPLTDVVVTDDNGTPNDTNDDFEATADLRNIPNPSAVGTVVRTYDGYTAGKFVHHPTEPYVYATIPSHNALAVINTETLNMEHLVFIGSGPAGLAITPDGSRVYVANSTSVFVGVFNTENNTALDPILVPESPRDIEVGANGQLYVLSHDRIRQIDPATGDEAGPVVGGAYSGEMALNAEKTRLFYGNYGLSPASFVVYDISVDPPVVAGRPGIHVNGRISSNGQDVAVSHNGEFFAYAAGSGQNLYQIAKYRTSDMAYMGAWNTGAYPREITFSPDDAVAYTVHTGGKIDLFDATTFLSQGFITTQGEAGELFVERTGVYLFAAFGGKLRVYSTGRRVVSEVNTGDGNQNGLLDPNETWNFKANGTAAPGQYMKTATATGKDDADQQASDTDMSYHFGVDASVAVQHFINGELGGGHPGPQIVSNDSISWTYGVSNTGNSAVSQVTVRDDNGTPLNANDDFNATYVSGDDNNNQLLDVNETWIYSANSFASPGQYVGHATVTAANVIQDSVGATSTIHYFGLYPINCHENVSSFSVGTIPDGVSTANLQLSDSRFELVGREVRLKTTTHLSADEDNNLELIVSQNGQKIIGFTLSVAENEYAWSNPNDAIDVDGDGVKAPIDALWVINDINFNGNRELLVRPGGPNDPLAYLDTNKDRYLSAIDALLVINELNFAESEAEGEALQAFTADETLDAFAAPVILERTRLALNRQWDVPPEASHLALESRGDSIMQAVATDLRDAEPEPGTAERDEGLQAYLDSLDTDEP